MASDICTARASDISPIMSRCTSARRASGSRVLYFQTPVRITGTPISPQIAMTLRMVGSRERGVGRRDHRHVETDTGDGFDAAHHIDRRLFRNDVPAAHHRKIAAIHADPAQNRAQIVVRDLDQDLRVEADRGCGADFGAVAGAELRSGARCSSAAPARRWRLVSPMIGEGLHVIVDERAGERCVGRPVAQYVSASWNAQRERALSGSVNRGCRCARPSESPRRGQRPYGQAG